MKFELPILPYDFDALEPHISARAMRCHYDQCHREHVERLNRCLVEAGVSAHTVEDIVLQTYDSKRFDHIYEHAAQTSNHSFFWHCMTPNGGGMPTNRLAEEVDRAFGSLAGFKEQFANAALRHLGSGYIWLVRKNDGLLITRTANADAPYVFGYKPLICCDVWEHAYFLDYQNARGDYVRTFLDRLVDWRFAEARLDAPTIPPQLHATG